MDKEKVVTNNTIRELRMAITRDFAKLYVKKFTTNWEAQRVVRALELELMDLPATLALLASSNKAARIDELNKLLDSKTDTLSKNGIRIYVVKDRIFQLQAESEGDDG